MTENYSFILDKSSKKYSCPECNKKTFVKYVDSTTGDYLPDRFGRCDRESNCGYFKTPPPPDTPKENIYYYVPFEQIEDYSKKAFRIKIKDSFYFLPKSQVLGVTKDGCFVIEYILKDAKAPPYNEKSIKVSVPKDGINESFLNANIQEQKAKQIPEIKPVFIPYDVLETTLSGYEINCFIQNLSNRISFPFESNSLLKVIELYYLGTITGKNRKGAITFPFIDSKNNIRAVQAKQFDETNHTTTTDYLHSIIERECNNRGETLPVWLEAYKKNEIKVSCPFGEHLLNMYPLNPVALVEAPKTAIEGTLYFGFPEESTENFIWMAVGSLSYLNLERCKALEGRNICLFPDLSKDGKAFDLWNDKAKEISKELKSTKVIVSDLLESLATNEEKASGADFADILIKYDWRKFRESPESEKSENSESPKQTFISAIEKIEPEPHQINHLQRFQQQARAAYKKYFIGKRTPENEKSYYVSWYDSMKSILNEYDITEKQIFNFIK